MNNYFKNFFFWNDNAHSAAWNMATDEILLRNNHGPILRIYSWNCKALSIGYSQKLEEIETEDFCVVRRYTGGGVVYHHNSYTYSLILPKEHFLLEKTRMDSYQIINSAVLDAISLHLSKTYMYDNGMDSSVNKTIMACDHNPTFFDLMLGDDKISGSAQRRTKAGLLQQGYIKKTAIPAKNLSEDMKKSFAKVFNCEFRNFCPSKDLLDNIKQLAKQKYSTKAWNYFKKNNS